MKNIVIGAVILIGLMVFFINKDSFPDTVQFNGEELKLAETSGKTEYIKTYQYATKGRVTGLNDYVQIMVIDESASELNADKKIKSLFKESYKLEPLSYIDGSFGVFKPAGVERNFYAYSIRRESHNAIWYINFVNQSNFGNKLITADEAKEKASNYISMLNSIYDDVSSSY